MTPDEAKNLFQEAGEICRSATEQTMNVTLQYDEFSLLRVDELIDRGWPDGVTGNMDQLVLIWGSFIGECLRTILNGEWVMTDAGWGIRCIDIVAHPFNKVEKRFRNGTGDSISFFYQALVSTINPSEQWPPSD